MPSGEITPEITGFVETYLDCFVSWDILAYFHENPFAERTLSEIALEVGRWASAIEPSLGILVERGVLVEEISEGDEPSYRYTAGREFKDLMDQFTAVTRDRTNRLAIVGIVLQKEGKRL